MSITITVEDGSVVDGANSFITVAGCDTYHENRGNTTWTGTDDEKAVALIRAGQYLNGLKWRGYLIERTQAMCWPRDGVVDGRGDSWDTDEIPQEIINAQCEAALRELVDQGQLQPDMDRGNAIKREKVDVIETEYFEGAPSRERFTAISDALWPWTCGKMSTEMVRS